MQIPLQITFRHMEPSEAMRYLIRDEADKLEELFDRITSCHVTFDQPHRHKSQGNHFRVRIEVKVPGHDIVVSRDPAEHAEHEDPQITVREAFDAARRQLQDVVQKLRQEVKRHESPPEGVVARLIPEEGFGFIHTEDGREVYFHEHSVLNGGFRDLEVGDRVRFAEEPGDKGPQASTVKRVSSARREAR
jgi:cold shock CspA family protein